jgi:uncharacterized membrane protein YfcA
MSATVFIALLIGVLSGLVAALCGVGGGIIMVPAFAFFLGMAQKEAVATSLGAIILIALAGTFKNHSNQLVHWPVAIAAALAGAAVAWFAADLLKHLSNDMLTRIFAVLLIVVGLRMLLVKA